jgi:hypothetical protein
MGTWETTQGMPRRAEGVGWQQPRNPPMSLGGVSVAIVLGAWKSHVQGEGPPRARWVRSNPVGCEGLGILADADGALRPGNPLRRGPGAVKVARTVPTGGMGKHRSAVRPVPTHS